MSARGDVAVSGLSFVWLEITGRCQLACAHCYADSGPWGTHGSMRAVDWRRVIDEAAGCGVGTVQFIGGEPTLHPDLARLVEYGLARGLRVEVFSNLVRVGPQLWETFSQPGVSLATSYYSDDGAEHEAVTKRVRSHARTRASIVEAVRRSIPLRVGIIDVRDGQRVQQAVHELQRIGVENIGVDRLRQVGRGVRDGAPGMEQLCGQCAHGVLAVTADGTVWPCVFTRWLPVGNVRGGSLADVAGGVEMQRVRSRLTRHFKSRRQADERAPVKTATASGQTRLAAAPGAGVQVCSPSPCEPSCSPRCSPTCDPIACGPRSCWPSFR